MTNNKKRILSGVLGLGMATTLLCFSTASAYEDTTLVAQKNNKSDRIYY